MRIRQSKGGFQGTRGALGFLAALVRSRCQSTHLITMADAFLNPFWVWLVHGELPAQAVYAGSVLVLGGIVWSNWPAKAARP